MWAERQSIIKGDSKCRQLIGSGYVITRWWCASEFLTGQVNYHFIRLFWVELEVISIGPLGEIT